MYHFSMDPLVYNKDARLLKLHAALLDLEAERRGLKLVGTLWKPSAVALSVPNSLESRGLSIRNALGLSSHEIPNALDLWGSKSGPV